LDLLAGIMSLGSGVAVNILKSRGLTESDPIAPTPHDQTQSDRPVQYESCALLALSAAISEALRMSHRLVGVEHMLAGILISSSPEVSSLLTDNGISIAETLSELRKNM
jgi:hypothetical protein